METENKNAKISIAVQPSEGYETHSWLRKIINRLMWHPFLNHIPKSLASVVLAKKGSRDAKTLKENAGNFKSIELMYTHNWRNYGTLGEKIFNSIWGSFSSVLAVRNRLRIVSDKIEDEIGYAFFRLSFRQSSPTVNILSVACGSARSVLRAVMSSSCRKDVNLQLIDKNTEALAMAKKLAKEYLITRVDFRDEDVFHATLPKEYFDVIEAVGLLEYLAAEEVIILLSRLRSALKPSGCLITSNILPNPEQKFITEIINWPLIYRTPEKLAWICERAGFRDIEIKIEPLGIQAVAVCKK